MNLLVPVSQTCLVGSFQMNHLPLLRSCYKIQIPSKQFSLSFFVDLPATLTTATLALHALLTDTVVAKESRKNLYLILKASWPCLQSKHGGIFAYSTKGLFWQLHALHCTATLLDWIEHTHCCFMLGRQTCNVNSGVFVAWSFGIFLTISRE